MRGVREVRGVRGGVRRVMGGVRGKNKVNSSYLLRTMSVDNDGMLSGGTDPRMQHYIRV